MAEELGKIEKPEVRKFENKRKLYLVPLLYSWQDAPTEYTDKLKLYWQQVGEHIANLESKIGKVNRVYHESITVAGEEGLKVLEQISPFSCQIVSQKCQSGAQVEAVEDMELVGESMDWERHLMMGFTSQKVAQMVSEFFTEASKKRYEHIATRIDETFKDNEAALLFIREGHLVQFPADIEVFSVMPPVLDEIHRWLRDRPATDETDESADKADES
ncbi:MAG: hypothetical protein V3R96_05860 [Dehalococcoidales bacterium]